MISIHLKFAQISAVFLLLSDLGLSQITLECDYSSAANQKAPLHFHWDICNRISPMGRINIAAGEKPFINVVRPLGGKSKNGKKLINEDTYKWDGENYVYDWAPLKKQIDTVREKAKLYQLMIDNPPWAFQRGLDLGGEDGVETYGNAWPPNDEQAWSLYIQAMLKELVKTYGRENVAQWRYCIGREIGTKGHWRGTRLEFFEHYRNTEKAIRAVIPEAKVGTHFLWASSKYSFGPDFVKWCKQNDVPYDFIGVSYYPFYNRIDRVDMDSVYELDFAPIKDIPEWNPSARLEIHEFALITSMSAKGNSYKNAPQAHQETFTVMLAKMMAEHDIVDVFQWGSIGNNQAKRTFQIMEGDLYYKSLKKGNPTAPGNMIDSVFALDKAERQYNIVAYNYNANPDAKDGEAVGIVATIPAPPKTELTYRRAVSVASGLSWSDWKPIITKGASGSKKSRVELSVQLNPFSWQKIEIRTPKSEQIKSSGTTRVLTERKTGITSEVEIFDVISGEIICRVNGQRQVIPISSLSDSDVKFFEEWVKRKN